MIIRYLKLTVIPMLAAWAIIFITALAARVPHAPEQDDIIWRVGLSTALVCYCVIMFALYASRKRRKS